MVRARIRRLVAVVLWPVIKAVGFLAYLLIRALEPWRRVRIGYLENDRIGHQAINTEMFLRARALDGSEKTCLDLFVSGPPVNLQLDAMIRRRLIVVRLPLLGLFHREGLLPYIAGTRFEADMNLHHYDFSACRKAPPQLSFTADEERRGKELLARLGIPNEVPFVCFHARTPDYLAARHPRHDGGDWSYHDFRDGRIENCIPAAEALTSRGIYALRVGAVVDQPIQTSNPMIIDYASTHRSDFGDIYLAARCKFFIGNTAGLVCVPWIFDVPVLMANTIPLFFPRAWGPADIALPNHLWDKRLGRPLTLKEMRDSASYTDSQSFEDAGIEVRENTADEILAAALEMNDRLDGSWAPHPDDAELQRRFQELPPVEPMARGCRYRIGADYLRRNRALLEV